MIPDRKCFSFMVLVFAFIFNFFIHNIQNKTTDTYSISQGPVKREEEREGQEEHKSLLYTITYIRKKTLPSINGQRLYALFLNFHFQSSGSEYNSGARVW